MRIQNVTDMIGNKLLSKGIVVDASIGAVAYAIQKYTSYSNDFENSWAFLR